jgi:hypothetical protein
MTAPDLHLRLSRLFLHRVLAAGGVALVLLLTVLAASPELHAWLHGNAGAADHECVITLYQHGVEAAAVGVALMAAVWIFLAWGAIAPPMPGFLRSRYWLPPALAPPVR